MEGKKNTTSRVGVKRRALTVTRTMAAQGAVRGEKGQRGQLEMRTGMVKIQQGAMSRDGGMYRRRERRKQAKRAEQLLQRTMRREPRPRLVLPRRLELPPPLSEPSGCSPCSSR